MARKKTITREQILKAAYEIIATEGFSGFTARNVAAKMNCSTQPIYLEFKNMEDLKNEVFIRIENYLREEIFAEVRTGEPVVDMALNYVDFATNEKMFYRALYIEEHSEDQQLNKFSQKLFMEKLNEDEKLHRLPVEKKEELFSGSWVVATGLASLKSGGLIHPSEQEIINLMEEVTETVLSSLDIQVVTAYKTAN